MPGTLDGIGVRVREERKNRGFSQRELARRLGLSASLISQIESGQSRPSVNTLYGIVTELGISLDHVFHEHPHRDGPVGPSPPSTEQPGAARARSRASPLVRPGERDVIELASGVRWERLTREEEDIDFLCVTYDVGGSSAPNATLMRHPGREYGYVISGRLGVQVGFESYELGPGDTIAFDSTSPHRLWNLGDEPVHGIWFVVGRDG